MFDDYVGKYCICRSTNSGVHAGEIKTISQDGKQVIFVTSRRLWYWDGAASLSQLSVDGVSKPENCKFPAATKGLGLTEVIEILPCTDKSIESIDGVKEWKA